MNLSHENNMCMRHLFGSNRVTHHQLQLIVDPIGRTVDPSKSGLNMRCIVARG